MAEYPDVQTQGFENQEEISEAYTVHVFSVWCAVSFNLNRQQFASDSFFPNVGEPSTVAYSIRMNPNILDLPFTTYDTNVHNDYSASADGWLNSGYLTLQNYIRTYVTNTYPHASVNFEVKKRELHSTIFDN